LSVSFTDDEILEMIEEPKPLPPDYRAKLALKPTKIKDKEAKLDLSGSNGRCYQLILRQNIIDEFDFSVILAHCPEKTNQHFRLRRYNGKSHEHTNLIERTRFYGFHIHTATGRYQQIGAKEDDFAEPTDRYNDLQSAIKCMLEDCGFVVSDPDQLSLLNELL